MPGRRTDPRILLFTTSPLGDGVGADERLAALLASTIPNTEFIWFARWPANGKPTLPAGRPIPIASKDGMPHAGARLQATLAAAVLSRRVDLVHAIVTVGTTFPLLSRLWPLLCAPTPVIHTVPGVKDPQILKRARPLGTTVALSTPTAQMLRDANFHDVRVVAPAISLASWPRQPRSLSPSVVLFAGHYDAGGGAEEAVAVAAAARRFGAQFRLVLAMRRRPGQNEQALAAALTRLARRQGLDDVVVHGQVPNMSKLLSETDVLLFTPRVLSGKADIPFTVLEALATGRPVIMSDLPQFAELGDAALRAPMGDSERAGRLLALLLAEPQRWQAAADRGHAVVSRRFGPKSFIANYEALYGQALDRRG